MHEMNKDLPYEQQVKVLLRYYDQLVEENKALKARIEEMTRYGDPAELKKSWILCLPMSNSSGNSIVKEIPESTGARRNW